MKMMKTKLKYVLIAAMGLSVMGGCKAPSLTPDEAVRLPEMYTEDTDTVTIATLSWKAFFPDDYLKAYIDTALLRNPSFLQAVE